MERYGDLSTCKDLDNHLFELIEFHITQNQSTKNRNCTLNNIWNSLSETDEFKPINMKNIFFDDAFSFYNTFFGSDYPQLDDNRTYYKYPLTKFVKNDETYFEKVFLCIANNLPLYYQDICMALNYNFDLGKRKETPEYLMKKFQKQKEKFQGQKEKLKELKENMQKVKKETQRFDSTAMYIDASDSEYRLPFKYAENNYADFCSFTWKNLYHNSYTIIYFKKYNRSRKLRPKPIYPLTIAKNFSNYPSESITNNDRWLIEKIFGINTIIELYPITEYYYNEEVNNDIYIPLLKELLKCKPIHLRVYLTQLVTSLLFSMQELNITYTQRIDYKKIYNRDKIDCMKKELTTAISKINIIYSTFLKCFYEHRITSISFSNNFFSIDNMPEDTFEIIKNPVDFLLPMHYSNTNTKRPDLLSYPDKAFYNGNDLPSKYGILQEKALEFNYSIYH